VIHYLLRRLALLPLTLFAIILVNFVIINLAPGDPTTVGEISAEGQAMRRDDRSQAFGGDERYLQFREHYGLTLPILWNTWPNLSMDYVMKTLTTLESRHQNGLEMSVKDYDALRLKFGDQSRFIMQKLLDVLENPSLPLPLRALSSRFFVRGGSFQSLTRPNLTEEEKQYNRKVGQDSEFLRGETLSSTDSPELVLKKVDALKKWYNDNKAFYHLEPTPWEKVKIFFVKTRFFQYFKKVLTLDFGSMRDDQNKTVISEVSKRFKYSLTLSVIPMFATFFLCLLFGSVMAVYQNKIPDLALNVLFLLLYSLPVFVVAPFLIEKIAWNHTFPFTKIPIPYSGFTSPANVYDQLNSYQRLFDTMRHIFLPLIAVFYGGLAVQSRLARGALLEVSRQDYVRTARAKGVPFLTILVKHIGRNASITLVTSIAGSLGVILGGSLIVETLFDIDGFGRFFYQAILNRDYNVIMFSAIASAFLSLVGYLVADIAYMLLDPRVTLE
jgi:peptide/nickel transport system permease protein